MVAEQNREKAKRRENGMKSNNQINIPQARDAMDKLPASLMFPLPIKLRRFYIKNSKNCVEVLSNYVVVGEIVHCPFLHPDFALPQQSARYIIHFFDPMVLQDSLFVHAHFRIRNPMAAPHNCACKPHTISR